MPPNPRRFVFALGVFVSLHSPASGQAVPEAPEAPPAWPVLQDATDMSPLPGTTPLTMDGDISAALVEGADRFLMREIAASLGNRSRHWNRDTSSAEAYVESIAPNRARFRDIIGLRDARVETVDMEFTSPDPESLPIARGESFTVYTVRWPAFREVHGEGLLLVPDQTPVADVVAIPDADLHPEYLAGLVEGAETNFEYARTLAAAGCRVLVPLTIERSDSPHRMSHREWLYRPAFELGRHLIGYELQKVFAGLDYFEHTRDGDKRKTGVIGWGEGGLLALYAAAADERIDAACVSGYFGSRQSVWEEPAYRNVFRLLVEFGDAEIASMIAPRNLIVESSRGPEIVIPGLALNEEGRPARGSLNGKPGRLTTPAAVEVEEEIRRAHRLVHGMQPPWEIAAVREEGTGCSSRAVLELLGALGVDDSGGTPGPRSGVLRDSDNTALRHARQVREIVAHNEWALRESAHVRTEFMKDLDVKSLEGFENSVEKYRKIFREDVIGRFDRELLPSNPRSRGYQAGEGVRSYEVVLDVFPDVIAYGILTLPDDLDLSGAEKRPVVVCQHGLEGRPQDVIGESKFSAYEAFATRLAQRGFITFAPQNLYLGNDKFRLLQFKANSIGKTLFSVIVPQHRQIVTWLGSLPYVDPERIAFYGLSYGGKSAMRIPPLVDQRDAGPFYCLSICSADFNEWVWKNCSTRSKYSYAQKREYEIFEWDLGSTFNYAEMAALIAPRPFMVERGHFDGVAPDQKVAHEFAKVRRLYNLLGIGERAEIEWFIGPHKINGVGTFDFLHRHLEWPVR